LSYGVVTEVPREWRLLAQVWHENAPYPWPSGLQKTKPICAGNNGSSRSSRCKLEWKTICPGSGVGRRLRQIFSQNTESLVWGAGAEKSERLARTGPVSSPAAREAFALSPANEYARSDAIGPGLSEKQKGELGDARESNRSVHCSFALGTPRH
jgi:hypothetical protein